MIKEKYSDEKLKLRKEVLSILLKKYGHENNNKAIYECAEEWTARQPTTSGLVSYFKAYYNIPK